MKWSEPSDTGVVSIDPKGYMLSMGRDGDEAIFEAWLNAGTEKDPRPVFIGSRRVPVNYRPGRKAAAQELRAACEAHAATQNSART